jgi:hypothetical protein
MDRLRLLLGRALESSYRLILMFPLKLNRFPSFSSPFFSVLLLISRVVISLELGQLISCVSAQSDASRHPEIPSAGPIVDLVNTLSVSSFPNLLSRDGTLPFSRLLLAILFFRGVLSKALSPLTNDFRAISGDFLLLLHLPPLQQQGEKTAQCRFTYACSPCLARPPPRPDPLRMLGINVRLAQ